MSEEHPNVGRDLRRQPVVIINLGVDTESFDDESSEEEAVEEETEPSHQEIYHSYVALIQRPYEFQDFDETQLILARILSITPDGEPAASLIYEHFDNLCKYYPQRVHDADNHVYSAPFIIEKKEDLEQTYELGREHLVQYNRDGTLDHLERSISCMRKAVKLAEETNPQLPKYLFGLADALFERFERFSEAKYLEDALYHQRRAIGLSSPAKPGFLANLGHSLLRRFQIFGHPTDLEEAIECQEQSVACITEDTEGAEACYTSLASSLMVRFENSGNILDLERAIELYQSALPLELGTDTRATINNNLGSALQLKCLHLIDIGTINNAITYQEQAVRLTSDENTEKPRRLTNLGNSLQIKFEHLGDMADIQSAISHQLRALNLLPKKHVLRAGILNDLGKSHLLRFSGSGEQADIERCLVNLLEAVKITPKSSPEWPKRLLNLGHALRQKFESQGILADIDHSITVYYEAVSAISQTHIDRAEHLDHLGSAYMSRFERLGGIADLDHAINQYRAALSIYGTGNQKAQASLNNLGIALRHRFWHRGRYPDIDESIAVIREAIQLDAKESYTPILLNSLSVSLGDRYKRTKSLEDIIDSIDSLERAIALTPSNHPDLPFWLNSLHNSLRLLCGHTGNIEDLSKAIENQKRAVSLLPEHHSDYPAMLRALGDVLGMRYEATAKPGETKQEDVIDAYRQAAISSVGKPHERFEAAYSWAEAVSRQANSPLEAYRVAFAIIPQVVWVGTTIHQRYHDVSRISRLTPRAVAHAIAEGEYSLALEWFEEGRSIVWRQMLDLRTPLEELREVDQPLAEELQRIGRALDRAGSSKPKHSISQTSVKSLEQDAQSHHRLAEKWDRLLGQVRQIEGFSDFLKAKKADTLMKAAHDGPVIAINVHETRCDAIIITDGGIRLDCVPLLKLSHQKALNAQKQLMRSLSLAGVRDRTEISRRPIRKQELAPKDELKRILVFLWSDIVQPILEHLQYLDPKPGDKLPHITWCVSGPLAFLPLHAAGHYTDPNSKSRVFNCVPSGVAFHVPAVALVDGFTRPSSPVSARVRSCSLVFARVRSYSLVFARVRSCPLVFARGRLYSLVLARLRPHSLAFAHIRRAHQLPAALSLAPGAPFNTPTINGLIVPSSSLDNFTGILTIGQASTPGLSSLPGTREELDSVARHAGSLRLTQLVDDSATPEAVLDAISSHSWVHFACHASQVPEDPTSSAFYLHDGTLDLNTISKQSLGRKAFAFLSACQTATGDVDLPEEVVHLAAGMIMAGYSTVIATMWSIRDSDAPLIAEHMYEEMLAGGKPESTRAARALHRALGILRDKIGETAFVAWVPYIHIGV